jgi:toxin ParE1/3/4
MKVRFTLEALDHINAIHFYISGRSPRAATHIIERIYADCERLAEFPRIGHDGMASGTYEWTMGGLPCIVAYEIAAGSDEIIVLGVFHGAQDR